MKNSDETNCYDAKSNVSYTSQARTGGGLQALCLLQTDQRHQEAGSPQTDQRHQEGLQALCVVCFTDRKDVKLLFLSGSVQVVVLFPCAISRQKEPTNRIALQNIINN